MVKLTIKSKADSDFVQALLNCCLKVNYETIVASTSLTEKLREIQKISKQNYEEFEDMLSHNICMVSHFTGVQVGI